MEKPRYVGPVLLLDNYGQDSRMLHESFARAGFSGPVVVVNDDGFLPEGVMCIYGLMCGDDKATDEGEPRYFNEVTVPDFWEISSTGAAGKVTDLDRERARIFYAPPQHERLVNSVDWLDRNGVVRSCDHYDRHGRRFARTVFDKQGQRFCKTYYSDEGKEVLVENYGTHTIVVTRDGREFVYSSREDFVLAFFEQMGIVPDRLFYNSLATPFFVAGKLPAGKSGHALFWQEDTHDEIPGNMKSIMSEDKWSTKTIYVQKKDSYERLIELGADAAMVRPLGFAYDFIKQNGDGNNALICTNSDNIQCLDELVAALPAVRFHIVALTEMSSKLMELDRHSNVSLYPKAKMEAIERLFMECDLYLDINHYAEIVSAVRRAFLHNHLIFSFEQTLHNKTYVDSANVFESGDDMIAALKGVLASFAKRADMLDSQRRHALAEGVDAYAALIEGA